MNIMQTIRNIIKAGLKSSTVDEKKIKIKFLGQEKEATKIIPYGLHAKMPNELLCVMMQKEGNEEDLLTLVTDLANRDTDLDEKEIAIGIPTLKDRIRFTNDSKIKIKLGDTLGGDYAVRYNELESKLQDFIDDFNNFRSTIYATHTHTFDYNAGPTPSSGTTNTGIPTGSDISIDFTDAKVENLELPEL